jgi:deoxyribodipyrimidine photo-lyase
VYEGLRNDYPHASWRHHRFILDGVAEMGARLAQKGVAHLFYLQRKGEPKRPLVKALSSEAALVVTDDYPAFIAPRQTARAAAQLDCPLYAVDGAGVAPMRAFPARETAAYTLRPKMKRLLPDLLDQDDWPATPQRESLPLVGKLPVALPAATELPGDAEELDRLVRGCGVDLSVRPAPGTRGGRTAGLVRLRRFLHQNLGHYHEGRNRADRDVTSNLGPYLHHGMLSPLEIARATIAASPAGASDENVAAFLEEMIVRRELALNFCLYTPEHETLSGLPAWARENLSRHAADPRPHTYDLATLIAGRTGDRLWNAVQQELRETGEPHGYLRMLWGKKLIEWAPTYEQALAQMILLNDRYAYDGRDANGYTNFLWCFGLHDRPFPRRPIFGVMRPMTSDSMGRKAGAAGYVSAMTQGKLGTVPLVQP